MVPLRRELRELQLLGEEARAARGRLDAELDSQRRELQEELAARAALEALEAAQGAPRDPRRDSRSAPLSPSLWT